MTLGAASSARRRATPTLAAINPTTTTLGLSWTPSGATVTEVGRSADSVTVAWSGDPSLLPFTYLQPNTAYTLYAIINGVRVETTGTTSATVTSPGVVPIDIPTTPATKQVFAHYVAWTEISRDNASQPDTWQTAYIDPTGSGGEFSASGGYWRDRPAIRAPLTGASAVWRAADCLTDCTNAKSSGIDGFIVDVAGTGTTVPGNDNLGQLGRLQTAAASLGGFAAIPNVDMSSGTAFQTMTSATFATTLAPYLKAAGAYKLPDGRSVLTAFLAENNTVAWWTATLAALSSAGVNVAFVPCFLDSSKMTSFAPISYGLGVWGNRTANGVDATLPGKAHALGCIWMAPVRYQDNRPYQASYGESWNGETNRAMWNVANSGEWVQIITWNDHAETSAFQPSPGHGWGILDQQLYELVQFKWGITPTIARNAIYLSHRLHPVAATPTYPETSLMSPAEGVAGRDKVEVVVYATAPDTLTTTIGGVAHTQAITAGKSYFQYPLAVGTVSASLASGQSVTSPVTVTNTPTVQDMQYRIAGSRR